MTSADGRIARAMTVANDWVARAMTSADGRTTRAMTVANDRTARAMTAADGRNEGVKPDKHGI